MALPPSVPTAFVPRESFSRETASRGYDFGGLFGLFAYSVLAIAIVVAIGVFAYGKLLTSQQASKEATVAQAEATLDQGAVTDLVRLYNRLTQSTQFLNAHQDLSPIFSLLEGLTLANVRFANLTIDASSPVITIELSGTAKSLNALATESGAVAQDTSLKNAIFSNIKLGSLGTVGFQFTGDLAPSVTAFAPSASAPAATLPPTGALATSSATSTASTTP